jgi:hypothetical protein
VVDSFVSLECRHGRNPDDSVGAVDTEFLSRTTTRIINEVRGINCVVYDIASNLVQASDIKP